MSFDSLSACKALILQLDAKFKISHEENATSFLGAKITYDRDQGVLTLTQEKFMVEIMKNFNMEQSKPMSTPMDLKLILSKEQCPPEYQKDSQTVNSYQYLIR